MYKKRCKHCSYLIEGKKGEWVCDIDNKACKDIAFCDAVEKGVSDVKADMDYKRR